MSGANVTYTGSTGPVELSAAGLSVTVQSGTPLMFTGTPGATITCSVACTVRVTTNGTPATGSKTDMVPSSSIEEFYVNSSSTGGTLLVSALVNSSLVIPLSAANGASVVTVAVLPITGTASITIVSVENR